MTNKIALITGSTSGIGLAIAEQFAALGARVVVHGLEGHLARAAVERIQASGGQATSIVADLRDAEACRRIVRFTAETYGGLDVLVNNAATLARGNVESVSAELWDEVMAINLRAPFLCLQEAVTFMKERGGAIVNVGSVNAYIGEPKLGPYSVSKGGLLTLTRNAATALARYRIRVNQINPGWTLTDGERAIQRAEGHGDAWLEKAEATRPFGKLLSPQDIAAAAVYFASDASRMVSGAVLDVDQLPVGAPFSN